MIIFKLNWPVIKHSYLYVIIYSTKVDQAQLALIYYKNIKHAYDLNIPWYL